MPKNVPADASPVRCSTTAGLTRWRCCVAYKSKEEQAEYDRQYFSRWYPAHKEHRAEYNKKYYQKNAASLNERNRKREQDIKEFVKQQKTGLSCKRCGNDDIRVLDFHHIDGSNKEVSIGEIARKGWGKERILRELAKCEVLCSNCHRILHWEGRNQG